ncbi:MAG TPA: hypothetical protein VHK91_06400 [Flavisolibacter sp.]|nr:hypothetical protein [Flavisolibacter sp.]
MKLFFLFITYIGINCVTALLHAKPAAASSTERQQEVTTYEMVPANLFIHLN